MKHILRNVTVYYEGSPEGKEAEFTLERFLSLIIMSSNSGLENKNGQQQLWQF